MIFAYSKRTPSLSASLESRFKTSFRGHAAGVAIVTADSGGGPVGTTITSLTSVSADPPAFAFSLAGAASAGAAVAAAQYVVMNLIGAEQVALAVLFSTSGADRFADTSQWDRLDTGEPYLLNARATLRGKILSQQKVGGSTLFVAEVVEVWSESTDAPGLPLVYHNGAWHALGDGSTSLLQKTSRPDRNAR